MENYLVIIRGEKAIFEKDIKVTAKDVDKDVLATCHIITNAYSSLGLKENLILVSKVFSQKEKKVHKEEANVTNGQDVDKKRAVKVYKSIGIIR